MASRIANSAVTFFDATITNNTVSNPDNISGALGNAIQTNMGTLPGDVVTACMDVKTNSIAGGGEDGDNGTLNDSQFDLRIRQRFSASTRLPGLPAGQGSDAGPFETGQNTLTTVTAIPTAPFQWRRGLRHGSQSYGPSSVVHRVGYGQRQPDIADFRNARSSH